MPSRAATAIPAAIVVLVFAAHFAGLITSFDSRWSIPTARSILHEGNISFTIHFRGAHRRSAWDWNSQPVDVDVDPTRIWDWRDPQFLRGLTRR